MPHPMVKATPGEFRRFLDDCKEVSTLWSVDANEQFAYATFHGAYTVDELMDKLEWRLQGEDCIYVRHPHSDDLPDEEEGEEDQDDEVGRKKVPIVDANDLDGYVVSIGKGKDFLYFDCGPAAFAIDGMTLLRVETEEEDN